MSNNLVLKNNYAEKNKLGNLTVLEKIDCIFTDIINIIKTPKYSYPWEPEFGTNLSKYPFEQLDDVLLETVQKEMDSDIKRWEDRPTNLRVTTKKNTRNHSLTINISFSYKGQTVTRDFNKELDKRLNPIDDASLLEAKSKFPIENIPGIIVEAY